MKNLLICLQMLLITSSALASSIPQNTNAVVNDRYVTVTGTVLNDGFQNAQINAENLAKEECQTEIVTRTTAWEISTSHPQGNTYRIYTLAKATFRCGAAQSTDALQITIPCGPSDLRPRCLRGAGGW